MRHQPEIISRSHTETGQKRRFPPNSVCIYLSCKVTLDAQRGADEIKMYYFDYRRSLAALFPSGLRGQMVCRVTEGLKRLSKCWRCWGEITSDSLFALHDCVDHNRYRQCKQCRYQNSMHGGAWWGCGVGNDISTPAASEKPGKQWHRFDGEVDKRLIFWSLAAVIRSEPLTEDALAQHQ